MAVEWQAQEQDSGHLVVETAVLKQKVFWFGFSFPSLLDCATKVSSDDTDAIVLSDDSDGERDR